MTIGQLCEDPLATTSGQAFIRAVSFEGITFAHGSQTVQHIVAIAVEPREVFSDCLCPVLVPVWRRNAASGWNVGQPLYEVVDDDPCRPNIGFEPIATASIHLRCRIKGGSAYCHQRLAVGEFRKTEIRNDDPIKLSCH